MFKTLRGRLITIFLIVVAAGWQVYSHGLKLGLDLQGGMHIVEEVADPDNTMSASAKSDAIARAERIIRTRIDELGVVEPLIQREGNDRLIVELPGITDQKRAASVINETAYLEFKLVEPTTEMEKALPRMDRGIVNTLGVDSIKKLGKAGEASPQQGGQQLEKLLFGGDSTKSDSTKSDTSKAVTKAQGPQQAAEDSAQNAEEEAAAVRPLTSLLNRGDVLGSFLVAAEDVPTVEKFLAMADVQRAMPRGQQLLWGQDLVGRGARNYKRLYVLESKPFLTGEYLDNATAVRDPQFNQSEVQFTLNRAGGRLFERFTGQHIGDYLAIVLDNQVMEAPVIKDRIGARGQIEMGANTPMADAQDLALVLRAGALPTKLNIVQETTVGPSLGQDSIDQGKVAGIVGIILVILIMVGYYRVAGFLSVMALGVYVLMVLGGLAGFNATLTVPGIAGIVLSVGMAVDANVLIFERIREELAAGRATRTAVDEGFANALSAIVDSNLTTLITGLILFEFGTGPVQGFAVTLTIGIVASFFSAIFVTRTFFLVYLRGKKASDPISI